jgi:hypothetical protein
LRDSIQRLTRLDSLAKVWTLHRRC